MNLRLATALQTLRRAAPLCVALFVALVWLNQGVTLQHYLAVEKRVLVDKTASMADKTRFPFFFLYRRSGDEELYFASANAIRGLPRDERVLTESRGPTPNEFRRAPPVDGRWHVPYREVAIEYPALMLPFILAPSLIAHDLESYTRVFGALMGACLVLACWFAIRARPDFDAAERRRAWWLASALMLAQGGLAIQRLDAVVALALAVSLWAASRGRMLVLGAAIGLATAAKFVPILFVPPLVAVLRNELRSSLARRRLVTAFAGGMAVGFVPMLVMSPGSIAEVLRYHADRGLHVESTLATVVGIGRVLSATVIPASLSFGSYNLTGYPADEFAKLCAPMMLLGAVLVTASAVRSSPSASRCDRVALALVSSLASAWIFGKVLSPQYLTWALPLVLTLAARSDRRIAMVYFAILVVTQVYLRGYYDYVYDQRPVGVATMLVRQALVVVLGLLSVRALAARTSLPLRRGNNFTGMNDVGHPKGEC